MKSIASGRDQHGQRGGGGGGGGGGDSGPPLLLFKGIGANWGLATAGFLEELTSTTPLSVTCPESDRLPRPSCRIARQTLARLAAGSTLRRGLWEVDAPVCPGAEEFAQQFAHQYPKLCGGW